MIARMTMGGVSAVAIVLTLSGCELGRKTVQQTGYRGSGLEQIYDTSSRVKAAAVPAPPYALPADTGPRARETYQNVQVLGDLSTERFNHLMASITAWVSPEQGCNYCHNPENMADDSLYTKTVARRMIQMTRAVNGQWATHVRQTGVTCYTCHRGQPVPANVWTMTPPGNPQSVRGQRYGQNAPSPQVGYSSLPNNNFERYFSGDPKLIRVASSSPYPGHIGREGTKAAEASYGAMMHVSQALGVNCTYCHNSQSFRSWEMSRAQRATAWYGINMVRDLNQSYITSLTSVFPANRKGPMGDPYKVNCLTCHQGQAKPLGGVSMIRDYPYFGAPQAATAGTLQPAVSQELDAPERMTDDGPPPTPPTTGTR